MMITPGDVLKQLAISAGYRVHVWDAVENGDAADSYFWKHSGVGGAQSGLTFPSPEQAWCDCCESNGLLAPIAQEIDQNGYGVIREPGFIAYRWLCQDGRISDERFAHVAEAVIACAIALTGQHALEEDGQAPRMT
jgi:hypothetical protein